MEFGDRVKETTTTTGTGAITLGGAVSGFRTFASVYADTDEVPYAIVSEDESEWEVGIGTMGVGTLARTTVVSSTNSNAAVNFSAGTKTVFATWPSNIAAGAERWANAIGAAIDDAGQFTLPAQSSVGAPVTNAIRLFGRDVGGRLLPAFVGPSGLDSILQPSVARNMVAWVRPYGNATTLTSNGMTLTPTGTTTAASVAVTNRYLAMKRLEYRATTASTIAIAGFRYNQAQLFRGSGVGDGGFFVIIRFGPATGVTSEKRCFVGLAAATGAPTAVNPSSQTNIIGVGYDSADTQWQVMHNDGAGAATKIDLGVSFPKPLVDLASVFELAMFCAPGDTEDVYVQLTDLVTGVAAVETVSTDLPAKTTLLAPRGWAASDGVTSSVVGIAMMGVYVETDF